MENLLGSFLEAGILFKMLAFIVVLSILVFVHELGHYLAAKSVGVKVERFSIGFGKKLFGHRFKNGEQWQVSMLPLGGYVQLFAMDPELDAKEITPENKDKAFCNKHPLARIWILLAGPLANFVFAVVALFILFSTAGYNKIEPIVAGVKENMPAHKAGILPGDRIININGNVIDSWIDVADNINIASNKELNIKVLRDGDVFDYTIKSQFAEMENVFKEKEKRRVIGIQGSGKNVTIEQVDFATAVEKSFKETYNITSLILTSVKKLIVGDIPAENLNGVLTIADESGKAAERGIYSLVMFMVLISINLGILNLLPIPMLDGGHIVYNVIELLTFGKGLHSNIKLVANFVGIAMLLSLMILAMYNDIVRLFFN